MESDRSAATAFPPRFEWSGFAGGSGAAARSVGRRTMTVAALYVETGGVYYGLPDVDPWDEERDARLYAGPWPVVAHPPCKAWSIMGQCRPEIVRGQDGGCFVAALAGSLPCSLIGS